MATIVNYITKERVVLNFHHVFGRNPYHSNTHHHELDVSQSHATIYWQRGHWFLKDHSRNGTLLNGEHIREAVKKLSIGQSFQFSTEENAKWQILDLDPPCSYIKPLEKDEDVVKLLSCHALPNETNPQVLLYSSTDRKWLKEQNDDVSCLENGDKIQIGDTSWVFIYNEVIEETLDVVDALKEAYFLLQLSYDEEYINLQLVISAEKTINLGSHPHNYVLLALARKRLEDESLGLAPDDQGWIYTEQLLKDLSKELLKEADVYYLNLQIFRFRKQLTSLSPFGHLLANVIQRRQGSIRFAHPMLQIVKDAQHIGPLMTL